MFSRLTAMFKKKAATNHMTELAEILSRLENKEELLGVKPSKLPTPDTIRKDANRLSRYSDSEDYKRFADEAWSRIINDLDVILSDKSSHEVVTYHRGSVKRTLDLLRISYQARLMLQQMDEAEQPTSQA